ncbi:ATP phosphoribosyltransferase, partial [Xylella fastidiosa subsp. multiplex]|nr:ATP phosphoribosyltransferase [Xylella fastidiosa subsp. multiplex]
RAETGMMIAVSARLIVNRAAYKMRSADLTTLVEAFRKAVEVRDAA